METKSKDNQQDDIIQVVDAKSLLQEYIITGFGGLATVVSFFMIFSDPAIGINVIFRTYDLLYVEVYYSY